MTIACKCGGMSAVKRSQPSDTTIRRRRVCTRCNARWTTIEIAEGEYKSLNDLARAVENLVSDRGGKAA